MTERWAFKVNDRVRVPLRGNTQALIVSRYLSIGRPCYYIQWVDSDTMPMAPMPERMLTLDVDSDATLDVVEGC